jgi:transglutaminase superfamily protein
MTEGVRQGNRAALYAVLLTVALAVALAVAATAFTRTRAGASSTTGLWQSSDAIAFRARFDPALRAPTFKWRAGVFSRYTGQGWDFGDVRRAAVSPNERIDVFSAEGDLAISAGRERLQITITPETFSAATILGPGLIEAVDRPVEAVIADPGHWYASIETTEAIGKYTISALVPVHSGVPGALTEADLRGAGTAYSPEMRERFTALPDGAMGPASTALLQKIRATVPTGRDAMNAYDLARTMETYLRDPEHFTYAVDIREPIRERCGGVSTVECFAIIRQGYCEYSASTMAVLLRASGVPARIAYGFLPGERDGLGNEVVTAARAHWWVEVYFPGVGWIEFDPDGGLGEPQLLPSGSTEPINPT